ncbi:MAG TPA: acetyl ornithine aminotransferase family protein [candidate division WOR-3 bacterium]|uniref:Acetyl ornithine aminotransferase family protein n=1 Tax=candidate division WOR-3 bacterium TaxID=2052148 RepID=A0A9C9JZZ4_UNCW3|nr:acetyl ornithine aminotransferase family protein [candidate division WOR-3 bacterium]
MKRPKIKTKLPGPKAKDVLRRDSRYVSPSYTRGYPLVIERGDGVWVTDVDGNLFLDFTSGIGVLASGHGNPLITEVIKKQAEKFIHMSGTDFYYSVQTALAEKLAEIVPGAKNKKVFFCNSGAEAVECAMKLTRYHTRRPRYVAFTGAFHGRTFGALSLTCSKSIQRKFFAPLLPEVTHIPYAYCFRCPFHSKYPSCNLECVKYIEDVVFKKIIPAEEVAALFLEPIQGEGGYIVPPGGFIPAIRKLCRKYDILLVDDEVQAGMGRTGRMFAIEHFNTKADVYCIAKGIASGLPLGACVANAGIMDWQPGSHGSTFGGNPVSCAAALKTIELLENGLIENAHRIGLLAMQRLKELEKRYDFIGEVRGKGLMIGIELVADKDTRTPVTDKRNAVVYEAFKQGLLLLGAGESAVRLIPSLVINEDEMQTGLDILEKALKKMFHAA